MRELRGVIIEETETGCAGTPGAMPVDAARDVLRAKIEQLMQDAIRFHEEAAEAQSNPAETQSSQIFNRPAEPNHSAIRITTGAGKSEATRAAAADYVCEAKKRATRAAAASYVCEAKKRGIPHRVAVYVPTHRLGEEARQRFPAGISTALLQSRKANDLATGEPLCRNLAAVEAAEAIGADVEQAACRKGRRGGDPILCPFYETCGYQRQRQRAKQADIVFAAHQYLSGPPEVLFKDVGVVVIDEGFWQSGLWFSKLAVDGLDAELQAFPVRDLSGDKNSDDTAHLADLIERLKSAVKASPVGEYLTKATLLAAGLLPCEKYENGSGANAVKLEWRRKVDVNLWPGAGEETCRRQAKQFGFHGQLPKRVAMWQAVEELLSGPFDATGRLRTEMKTTADGSVLYLKLNGRRDVHERIAKVPVMALDATLNIDVVNHFFPRIKLALDLEVRAPHERVIQVVGLPVGKASLSQLEPGRRRSEEEQRVANKRERLLTVVRRLAAGRPCVVITNKELTPLFDGAGQNIDVAHFNAIEGIDRWRCVDVLITIGRPLPSPKAVEDMGAALTGKPVSLPEHPPSHKGGRPQQMIVQNRPIRLKTGAEVALSCRVFELREAELIRQAVTEAAIVQAIGRARGVNRTAENPVEVFMILHDTTAPIAVDSVVEFDELEPTKIDLMIERGLIPQWGADAAKLYPDLWPTAQAARKEYSRAGLDVERLHARCVTSPYKGDRSRCVTCPYKDIFIRTCHSTPILTLLRYQPKLARGGGAKARMALVDQARLADARKQLEEALGQLALFEIVTGEDSKSASKAAAN
jgi:putative DNA primase/helicase